jgi:hypothetical protein
MTTIPHHPSPLQSLGVVHVLTGPDHLSAIATLSANVDNTACAFFLGVRWGLGHSTGLLLVGAIFIALSVGKDDTTVHVPEVVSHGFETLVGLFMLLLGAYGLHKACYKKRPAAGAAGNYHTLVPHHHGQALAPDDEEAGIDENTPSGRETCALGRGDLVVHLPEDAVDAETNTAVSSSDESSGEYHDDTEDEVTTEEDSSLCRKFFQVASIRTMATAAGIVHGLAGPGGILGVIPAVQLHSARLATIYLGSFCASSTLTMGLFALLYGRCSSCMVGKNGGRREVVIESLSAVLSILVGVTWLTLLSVGKLDDVFP